MKGPHARQIQNYACHCLGLKSYFQHPGDGRAQPRIPAGDMLWAVVMGRILRVPSFLRLEWLVHSPVRAELGVRTPFGDDALAYCTERMDPEVTRVALAAVLRQAKRNKAFENSRFIGLALDGTGAGRTYKNPCPLCVPVKDAQGKVAWLPASLCADQHSGHRLDAAGGCGSLRRGRPRIGRRATFAATRRSPPGAALCRLPGGG